jgi:hypothetical protein
MMNELSESTVGCRDPIRAEGHASRIPGAGLEDTGSTLARITKQGLSSKV